MLAQAEKESICNYVVERLRKKGLVPVVQKNYSALMITMEGASYNRIQYGRVISVATTVFRVDDDGLYYIGIAGEKIKINLSDNVELGLAIGKWRERVRRFEYMR